MNIPDKAIEAARSALIGRNNNEPSKDARAAVEAAAPFIAAQALHDAATEFDQTDPIETALDTSYPVHWLRARAAGLEQ